MNDDLDRPPQPAPGRPALGQPATGDDATSRDRARLVAAAADEKKGIDTVILDVGDVLAICELFVVTSAPNTRLVRTIAEEIEVRLREAGGGSPLRVEGLRDLQWVLVDYGDVVVHVFHEETRRFYDIERLYRDVPRVEWEPLTSALAPDRSPDRLA
jgi:ribosome-associated protein